MIRGAEAGARTAGPPSTMAAAPSVNELHMRRVSTPATWGDGSTSSMVTVRWHWASGLRDAWSKALTAAAAIWRGVAPTSAISRWAQPLLSPIRMLPAGLSSACRGRAGRGGTPPAGRPRSRRSSRRGRPSTSSRRRAPAPAGPGRVAAMVARCRAELPPAHELSTLMMATSLSPALRSQVCPRMQPWSLSRPAMALPTMTRPSSWGDMPASPSASWVTW